MPVPNVTTAAKISDPAGTVRFVSCGSVLAVLAVAPRLVQEIATALYSLTMLNSRECSAVY
jgi:hypothetical protein